MVSLRKFLLKHHLKYSKQNENLLFYKIFLYMSFKNFFNFFSYNKKEGQISPPLLLLNIGYYCSFDSNLELKCKLGSLTDCDSINQSSKDVLIKCISCFNTIQCGINLFYSLRGKWWWCISSVYLLLLSSDIRAPS